MCNRTRGHNFKLSNPVCSSNVRRHYFASRLVPIWNSLALEVVNLTNVLGIKKRLKCTSLDKFLLRKYSIFFLYLILILHYPAYIHL